MWTTAKREIPGYVDLHKQGEQQITETMKAIRKVGPRPGAEMVDIAVPKIADNEVLIKVKTTSICGTDAHIYEWDPWSQGRVKPPQTYGHEFCGEIVEAGRSVRGFKVGDYVSCDSHIPCMTCYQCRAGQAHICANLQILGVDRDGSFAEYIALPTASLVTNPAEMPPDVASIQDPLGNAIYAVLVTNVSGKTMAIFGMGPIGLFAVGVARASGAAKIFAIGHHDFRLGIARKMGADVCANSNHQDVVEQITDATDGLGVDVVLDMAGSPEAVSDGFQVVRKGGEFVAFGIPKEPFPFDYAAGIVFKGVTVYGINGRLLFKTWHQMANLLTSGRLDVSPVITHKLPWTEYEEGFKLMTSSDKRCGKVVLTVSE